MHTMDWVFVTLFIFLIIASLVHGHIVRRRIEIMEEVIKDIHRELNRHIKFASGFATTKTMEIREER